MAEAQSDFDRLCARGAQCIGGGGDHERRLNEVKENEDEIIERIRELALTDSEHGYEAEFILQEYEKKKEESPKNWQENEKIYLNEMKKLLNREDGISNVTEEENKTRGSVEMHTRAREYGYIKKKGRYYWYR